MAMYGHEFSRYLITSENNDAFITFDIPASVLSITIEENQCETENKKTYAKVDKTDECMSSFKMQCNCNVIFIHLCALQNNFYSCCDFPYFYIHNHLILHI